MATEVASEDSASFTLIHSAVAHSNVAGESSGGQDSLPAQPIASDWGAPDSNGMLLLLLSF